MREGLSVAFWTHERIDFGHMSITESLARDLHASDRTLRRAVARDLLRGRRPSPNKLELSPEEVAYARTHWPLIEQLVGALRTEPSVEAAILYGSAATGVDRPDSDIDVAVKPRGNSEIAARALARRLQLAVDRDVHVVRLGDAIADGSLAIEIVERGRPLVDRADVWSSLKRRRTQFAQDAEQQRVQREQAMAAAWSALPG
jgi:predicted nucleotidyltransferase